MSYVHRERIILMGSEDDTMSGSVEDDLYKGYNEFHPVLDTRNIQDDAEFRETVKKSGYGKTFQHSSLHNRVRTTAGANSTAGLAFSRSNHGLKSRRTSKSCLNRFVCYSNIF